jgi:hypothetical protein
VHVNLSIKVVGTFFLVDTRRHAEHTHEGRLVDVGVGWKWVHLKRHFVSFQRLYAAQMELSLIPG